MLFPFEYIQHRHWCWKNWCWKIIGYKDGRTTTLTRCDKQDGGLPSEHFKRCGSCCYHALILLLMECVCETINGRWCTQRGVPTLKKYLTDIKISCPVVVNSSKVQYFANLICSENPLTLMKNLTLLKNVTTMKNVTLMKNLTFGGPPRSCYNFHRPLFCQIMSGFSSFVCYYLICA